MNARCRACVTIRQFRFGGPSGVIDPSIDRSDGSDSSDDKKVATPHSSSFDAASAAAALR